MGEPKIGDFIGKYQLEKEVGLGGAARLFRAHHVNPSYGENIFALKVLHETCAADPEVVTRFRKEAYILSTLRHPNIVDTFEAGVQDDDLYIAMEFVHGRDFGDILDEHDTPLPEPLALHIVRAILEALHYAHNVTDENGDPSGIIHMDIKPSNILISYDGRVKLTDFGIAALSLDSPRSEGDQVLGTKGYFAPEQLSGSTMDHRVDIFGVGVLMYEALCGRQPFEGSRTSKILRQNRRATLTRPRKVNPNISPELEAIILKALERKPNRRFANCQAMLDALENHLPHPSGMALALGSYIRALFVSSPDFVSGPWQRSAETTPSPVETQIALCASDENLRLTVSKYLEPLGVIMTFHNSPALLAKNAEKDERPRAILVDIDDPAFAAAELLTFQIGTSRPVPVVTIGDALEPRVIAVSDAVGAVEILTRPLQREVTCAAVRRILLMTQLTPSSTVPPERVPPPVKTRVLLLTRDRELGERITFDFEPWGYLVDVTDTADAAMRRMDASVYKAVLYDLAPPATIVPDLVTYLRGLPGVGIVPVLYLKGDQPLKQEVTLLERTAIRPRSKSSVILASTVAQLRAITHLGRTFRRIPMQGMANLSFRGRTISCRVENISRGGVLLFAGQMPALGTACSVEIVPKTGQPPFTLNGRVVRLILNEQIPRGLAGVGVAFLPSDRNEEWKLTRAINYLALLRAPLLTPPPRRFETHLLGDDEGS